MICDKCARTVDFVYEYTWFNGVINNTVRYCDACYVKGLPPSRHQMVRVGGTVRIVVDAVQKAKTGPKRKKREPRC